MATVSLQNTELTIVEGNFSNVTFVEICAVLVNVAAGLQRSVEINFTSTSDTATGEQRKININYNILHQPL